MAGLVPYRAPASQKSLQDINASISALDKRSRSLSPSRSQIIIGGRPVKIADSKQKNEARSVSAETSPNNVAVKSDLIKAAQNGNFDIPDLNSQIITANPNPPSSTKSEDVRMGEVADTLSRVKQTMERKSQELHGEITDLQNSLNTEKQKRKSAEEKVEFNKNKLALREKELIQKDGDIQRLTLEVQRNQALLLELESNVQSEKKLRESENTELLGLRKLIEELEKDLQKERKARESLARELDELRAKFRDLDAENEKMNGENKKLLATLQQLEQEKTALVESSQLSASEEVSAVRKLLEQTELEKRLLNEQLIETQSAVSKKNTDLALLDEQNQEMSRLKSKVDELEVMNADLNRIVSEKNQVSRQLQLSLEEAESSNRVLKEAADKVAMLQRELSAKQQESISLRSKIQDMTVEQRQSTEALDQSRDLASSISKLQERLHELTVELNVAKMSALEWEERARVAQEGLEEVKNTAEKNTEAFKSEINALRSQMDVNGSSSSSHEKEMFDLQKKLRSLTSQVTEKVSELNQVYEKVSTLTTFNQELTKKVETLNQELRTERQKHETVISTHSETIIKNEKLIQEKTETIRLINTESAQLKEELYRLRQQISELSNARNNSEKQQAIVNSMQDQIHATLNSLQSKEMELDSMRHRYTIAQQEIESLKQQLEASSRHQLSSQHTQTDSNLNRLIKESQTQSEQIVELQTTIKELKSVAISTKAVLQERDQRITELEEKLLARENKKSASPSKPDDSQLSSLMRRVDELESQSTQLKSEKTALEEKMRQMSNIGKFASRVANQDEHSWRYRYEQLQLQYNELQKLLKITYSEMEALQQQLSDLRTGGASVQASDIWKQKYVQACTKITQLIKERRNILLEYEKLKQSSMQWKADQDSRADDIQRLQERNSNLLKIVAHLSKYAIFCAGFT